MEERASEVTGRVAAREITPLCSSAALQLSISLAPHCLGMESGCHVPHLVIFNHVC